ncbi:MAG TPA: sugar porter family MFS transporter [Candidatus Paceibacterota bacterium]|nr:sugar porter family MFS transporter [Verrucomicrobiota bacterium]HSA11342.1 sugar porter family MFS transporter [Candidatus Paceibacterota bacterium]
MTNSTTSPGLPRPARLTAGLLTSAIVAALGGLLFGFDTAVISGTTDWLKSQFTLTDFSLGFTVSSALVGTIIGSVVVGKPADALGRRGVLFLLAILFFVSAIGCALAWDWWSFMLFRFLGGLAVGGASVVSPMYIAEISPAQFRGRLVAITQFNIVLGILLAYLSNYIIGSLYPGPNECRWMFGVMAAPSALFFCLLFITPQSPRWLIARGRDAEARAVFEKCGTDLGNVEEEIKEIQASLDLQHHRLEEPFFCRKYLKPILLAVAIAAFNQLSGINALIYYTAHIFKMAGAGAESALLQSVIIGVTNLVFTMAALAVIDHFGRRRLMLVGSFGYILSLSAAAYAFYTNTGGKLLLISLLVFIASHAFGQGAVIWVFISEIFPNRVRARGQALGSFTHWIMAAAISWTFPIIAAKSGGHTFAFYAVCMVGQLLWVWFLMPETKGVSLEQIQKRLGIK